MMQPGARLSSRRYLKRVYRVPKDRGATAYLAALVHKALVKHGWPARVELVPFNWGEGFQILHYDTGLEAAEDFWQAAQVACRIMARTYGVELDIGEKGLVMFLREYRVTTGGFFKEI